MKKITLLSVLAFGFANAAPLAVPANLETDLIGTGTAYGTSAINVVVGIALVIVGYRLAKKFFG